MSTPAMRSIFIAYSFDNLISDINEKNSNDISL